MSIPVVILAGGKATRLRPLSTNVPKSLIPIYEKPFIFYQLELLRKNKINKVHVCLGYLGEMVEEVINESLFAKKMRITFSYDGSKRTLPGFFSLSAFFENPSSSKRESEGLNPKVKIDLVFKFSGFLQSR